MMGMYAVFNKLQTEMGEIIQFTVINVQSMLKLNTVNDKRVK